MTQEFGMKIFGLNAYGLAIIAVLFLCQGTAMADGIVLPEVDVSGESEAAVPTAQKALLWKRADGLELWIDSKFLWKDRGASWVVPLPVNPEIKSADSTILENLTKITTPIFITVTEQCQGSGGYGGYGTDASMQGNDSQVDSSSDQVMVWQSGSLGALDYVVLSAKQGNSIVKWLKEHKYQVNDTLKQGLASAEAAGKFFFVARLSGPPKDDAGMGAVRFVFPATTPPFYPLQLTSMQIPKNGMLNLLLFVLWPMPYIPVPQPVIKPNMDQVYSYLSLSLTDMESMYEENFDPDKNSLLGHKPLMFFNEDAMRIVRTSDGYNKHLYACCSEKCLAEGGADLWTLEMTMPGLFSSWDGMRCMDTGLPDTFMNNMGDDGYVLVRLRAVVRAGLNREPEWKFMKFEDLEKGPLYVSYTYQDCHGSGSSGNHHPDYGSGSFDNGSQDRDSWSSNKETVDRRDTLISEGNMTPEPEYHANGCAYGEKTAFPWFLLLGMVVVLALRKKSRGKK